MKRRALIIGLFVFAIVLGFAMENLKVNVNYILERGSLIPGFFNQNAETKKLWLDGNRQFTPYDYYYNHTRIEWLFHLSYDGLIRLKWFNTVFFTALFMLITALMMQLVTGTKQFFRWTIFLYTAVFILSFVIYLFGKFTGTLDHAYGVSRKITGALQSLVPLMILVPASWLMKNFSVKK